MFGIELLAAPALHLLVSGNVCPQRPIPNISVNLQNEKIAYDTSKSYTELNGFKIDTVSPYGAEQHSRVSGLMAGNVSVESDINIAWSTNSRTQQSCLWFDTVNITLRNSPTIYIASEHKNNKCRYNSTLQHEMKHVTVDKNVMKKYTAILHRDLKNMILKMGTIGPVRSKDVDHMREEMGKTLGNAIRPSLDEMHAERKRKQQMVDTKREYDRLSKLCGGKF